jgi:hypothetical protein
MSAREIELALDEVLGLVQEVKQARWKMAPSDELRRALQALFEDCAAWAAQLAELAAARGGDVLGDVATAAGRPSVDLFPGEVYHAGLVRLFDDHLSAEAGRIRGHADACRDDDPEAAAALDEIGAGLERHRTRIAELA